MMNLKPHSTAQSSYTPVPWEYREVIEEQIATAAKGKVFYFGTTEGIGEAFGRIIKLDEEPAGVFIELDDESRIRIDRIITLFGKPGAAYDEYDAYANACMECMGGHEMSDFD